MRRPGFVVKGYRRQEARSIFELGNSDGTPCLTLLSELKGHAVVKAAKAAASGGDKKLAEYDAQLWAGLCVFMEAPDAQVVVVQG